MTEFFPPTGDMKIKLSFLHQVISSIILVLDYVPESMRYMFDHRQGQQDIVVERSQS